MKDILINGIIGYTILKKDGVTLIIFADSHDGTINCGNNQIYISDYFRDIIKNNNVAILLEEPPRLKNSLLVDIWTESKHTQKLKELYLSCEKYIKGIDIRYLIIPFSWEVESDLKNKTTLNQYIENFRLFFEFKFEYVKYKLEYLYTEDYCMNSEFKNIFFELHQKFNDLIDKNKEYLSMFISEIVIKNVKLLEKLNEINNKIMEYFAVFKIKKKIINKKNIIIVHAGLYHTTSIINVLKKHFGFEESKKAGVNNINEIYNKNVKSCLKFPTDYI
jgi:hypothetical protein